MFLELKCDRYVLAVLMSTVVERQTFTLEFESIAEASGYFTLRVGITGRTAIIPYDAVSTRRTNINILIYLGMVRMYRATRAGMFYIGQIPTSY